MLLLSLLHPATAAFPALNIEVPGASVRLIIIGDTGARPVSVASDAAWEGSQYITHALREQMRLSMRAEQADGIVVTGDLVYGPTIAQLSPRCRDTDAAAETWLDPVLGSYFEELPTTWLALGNHDVGHYFYSRARARCLHAYAATTENIRLPEANYTVDFGLAQLFVLDTNRPTRRWPSEEIQRRMDAEDGWVIMGGHHVLKTAFDKESESEIRTWIAETGLAPDLWINGHAHFLQFGVYDGIPALTSGSGSKIRAHPDCPGPACVGAEAPLFSRSTFGYAVVDLTADEMTMRIKGVDGQTLYCWQQTRGGEGRACAAPLAAPAPAAPTALGSHPLCEPSAALAMPDGSVLIGDNEVEHQLFVARYADGVLHSPAGQDFAQPDAKADGIEDIEALAGIDGARVLVVGSHSRNKKCALQPERRRLGVGSERVKTSDGEWAEMVASASACRENLFGGADGEDIGRLCAAIVAAEGAEDCTGTFNIEGALTDAAGRTWLGLRAPVVADRGAAMVRLAEDFLSASALSLDAVAWVSLPDQQAIRALHSDGDALLGIAGAVADAAGSHSTLWRAPMAELQPGALLSVEALGLLPPSSEGLTRVGPELIVVVDGDAAKDPDAAACREAAGQLRIAVP